jgi:hypothetical protein
MKKKIIISILVLMVVVAFLGGIKVLQIERMTAQARQSPPPRLTTPVHKETWESRHAVGSPGRRHMTATAE